MPSGDFLRLGRDFIGPANRTGTKRQHGRTPLTVPLTLTPTLNRSSLEPVP